MDISIYLARVFGIYLIIACLAIFLNRNRIPQILKGFTDNLGLVVFTGFIHLLFGLLVVIGHNIWTTDFRSIITLLGWAGIVKGAVRLIAPHKISRLSEEFSSSKKLFIWGVIWLIVGIYLTLVGFWR